MSVFIHKFSSFVFNFSSTNIHQIFYFLCDHIQNNKKAYYGQNAAASASNGILGSKTHSNADKYDSRYKNYYKSSNSNNNHNNNHKSYYKDHIAKALSLASSSGGGVKSGMKFETITTEKSTAQQSWSYHVLPSLYSIYQKVVFFLFSLKLLEYVLLVLDFSFVLEYF